ncbi:MAG TPA: hypothetical protein VEG44_03070 [Candidatus Acidoferrales bacterium]|nr:hypothetical protein [Candidatus Acidoferrales bacterium]
MISETLKKLYRFALPDDTSSLIFYASLALFIAIWNINIFINDEVTLVGQLFNLVHGSLSMAIMPDKIYEGLGFGNSAPILGFTLGGKVYAFYTHAVPVFAIPFYYLLYMANITIGIRLFFVTVESFSIFMIAMLVGKRCGRARLGVYVGIFTALVVFSVNAYIGSTMAPLVFEQWGALMAIQLLNIVATALVMVISYRIFNRYFQSTRLGEFGAMYLLIATPLTFWAVASKDHAISVFLIVASIGSFYKYLLEGKTVNRYISYALVGLTVWVRIFDAVPLFAAIFVTDIVTSRGKVKSSLTAFATVILSLIPYFINNYLLFGNPLLSPVYLSAHQELASESSVATSGSSSSIPGLLLKIPSLFLNTWKPEFLPYIPQNLFNALFYVNMPVTLSLFQICPLLILPVIAGVLYLARTLVGKLRSGPSNPLNISGGFALNLVFAIYIAAHLLAYAPFGDQGFGLDMRYYVPLYVPLLFFSLVVIKDVVKRGGFITRSYIFSWAILIFVAAYIVHIPLNLDSIVKGIGFSFNRTIGTATLLSMALFIPYLIGFKGNLKWLSVLVGFATFVSSCWLFVAVLIWQKTPLGVPRPGMMLPLMDVVNKAMISLAVSIR